MKILKRGDAPCPACLDRNALTLIGRPLFVQGMKLSAGCEICGGTGRVVECLMTGDVPWYDKWVVRTMKWSKEDASG